jgi:capsular polysaccharide transport system permease protein
MWGAGPMGNVERSIRVWLNVINAIILRDIRVRAGKFYTGYLIIFLMPFAHLGILLAFYTYVRRGAPFGNQEIIFFGISMLPFVIFVYPARQVLLGPLINHPLLYFPRVKIMDLVLARGVLEFANGMAVAALVCLVLFLAEGEFAPRDPLGFLLALALPLYLGFGWGAYNCIWAQLFPFWAMAFNLIFPVVWLSAGIIFYVHGLPHDIVRFLAFNPILQCVEYIRYAYFDGYPDDLLDAPYVFWFATVLVVSAMVLERVLRRRLMSA